MKRILILLSVAAALVACKKDKTPALTDADLIGTWFCTESIDPDNHKENNPGEVLIFWTDHTAGLYFDGMSHSWNWFIQDGKLIFMEGPYCDPETTIAFRDGKHMKLDWIWGEEGLYQESFIRMESILPGTWTVSWPGRSYTVTITADGNSSWVLNGTVVGSYSWAMDHNDNYPLIKFNGGGWSANLKVVDASDNRIETKDVDQAGAPVIFVRQ